MIEFIKKNLKLIILVFIFIILLSISILIFCQKNICQFSYKDENYKLNKKVEISYFSKISENITINSNEDLILNDEKEEFKKAKYKLNIKNNTLVASKIKKEKKNYYNLIKSYKKKGYTCKFKLF